MHVDRDQIARFAKLLPSLSSIRPFDFCGTEEGVLFPLNKQAGALETFFFNAAHQFGFWYLEDGRYTKPMIAQAGGVNRKGSDFMFFCTQRALNQNPSFFDPVRLDSLDDDACDAIFHDDHGRNPLPMWPEHLAIIRGCASWFVREQITPHELVDRANASTHPLKTFLDALREIPGYKEDPLQKKAMLLAIILENRPEHFLNVTDPESAVPIIDYHLQRSALRTGLVRVDDPALRQKIEARAEVTPADEQDIRQATYDAIQQLVELSGLSVAAVDYFFFMNRTKCPEMTEPKCPECPVRSICKKETTLFQPVIRTTSY